MVPSVNALAKTTGSEHVPDTKIYLWYRHEKDKFGVAGSHEQPSETVLPPRIRECPAQMEVVMVGEHEMMSSLPGEAKGFTLAIELRVTRTYVLDEIRMAGHENRMDPDQWRPTIMYFQQLYGLKQRTEESTVATVEEEMYRVH